MNLNILFLNIKKWQADTSCGKRERFARLFRALSEFRIKRKGVLNGCFDEIQPKISCTAKTLYPSAFSFYCLKHRKCLDFIPVVSLVGSLKIH